jgi:hypothetical protein
VAEENLVAEEKTMNDRTVPRRPELVCPAGTPTSLRTAVDAGADTVYCGLQNATNARNFPGLNFSPDELRKSVDYARARGGKVLLAVNTFPPAGQFQLWKDAVGIAASVSVDAIIVADIGVAAYASREYPQLRLHLSVQAGASSPEAIRFHVEEFGIKRVVTAAYSDRRRDCRYSPADSLRDRSVRIWKYRNDGRRPLQPDKLRDRHFDQYGRRVFARGRGPLSRRHADNTPGVVRHRSIWLRRKRRLSDHLQGTIFLLGPAAALLRL